VSNSDWRRAQRGKDDEYLTTVGNLVGFSSEGVVHPGTIHSAVRPFDMEVRTVWVKASNSGFVPLLDHFGYDLYVPDVKPTVSARFEHDCEACEFVGHFRDHDIYWCPERMWDGQGRPRGGQWVVRSSSDGPDYISCSGFTLDKLLRINGQ
jgi:hypothetical protein